MEHVREGSCWFQQRSSALKGSHENTMKVRSLLTIEIYWTTFVILDRMEIPEALVHIHYSKGNNGSVNHSKPTRTNSEQHLELYRRIW
uniref:Ovule protein n=1 Tax=Steinernema glaseri TaxID=37863 RepID=A0A1I8AHU9_9BILA